MAASTNARHSAVVQMELRIGDLVIPICQMGRGMIMTRHPVDHPPTICTMTLSVDGQLDTFEAYLPNGIKSTDVDTKVEPVTEAVRASFSKAA